MQTETRRERLARLALRTDRFLVEGFRRGDELAFRTLYYRHRRLMWSRAFKILEDYALAGDAVQIAFIRIANEITSGREIKDFRGLLWMSVRNRARDIMRKHSYQFELPMSMVGNELEGNEAMLDPRPIPEDKCHTTLALELVEREMEHLPEKQRLVLQQCVIEGRPVEEVAETLNTTVGTIRSFRSDAKRRLRARLPHLCATG